MSVARHLRASASARKLRMETPTSNLTQRCARQGDPPSTGVDASHPPETFCRRVSRVQGARFGPRCVAVRFRRPLQEQRLALSACDGERRMQEPPAGSAPRSRGLDTPAQKQTSLCSAGAASAAHSPVDRAAMLRARRAFPAGCGRGGLPVRASPGAPRTPRTHCARDLRSR